MKTINCFYALAVLAAAQTVSAQQAAPAQIYSTQPSQVQTESAEALKEKLGNSPRVSPKQKEMILQAEAASANKAQGKAYLDAYKKKQGVQTLPNGVMYRVVKKGAGKTAQTSSKVTVRYEGTLTDGSSFDKVYEAKPAPMQVKGFVPGLQSAMLKMNAGSKYEVVIPPEQGYGQRGNHLVGPDAVLIYNIELLGIK